jgi:hypothetical protein
MHRAHLLIVSAILEVGAGLALLVLPAVPLALLLGGNLPAPETLLAGRVAGAALLALGVAGWLARADGQGPALHGLLIGFLIYDGAAAALLGYAGLVLNLVGIMLWPAVVLHTALAIWCVLVLWAKPRDAQ